MTNSPAGGNRFGDMPEGPGATLRVPGWRFPALARRGGLRFLAFVALGIEVFMGSLIEVIREPARRAAVLRDCESLIDAEVDDKGGLSGMAVKAAFRSVKSLRPDMIRMSMDALLDDFAHQIDPFWQDCQRQGENPRAYFLRRQVDLANALLTITDRRAQTSSHKVLVKAYSSLRGKAVEYIGAAMPRFSDLLVKHAS